MAETLQEAPSTIQSWKAAGRIPATKQPDVLEHANMVGITAEDVIFPLRVRPDIYPADDAAPATPRYPDHPTAVRSNDAPDFDHRGRS